ncbi:alpha-ketoglutarate-dependent dioxygenase alkB homolog 7, mitochondrial isoform X2 [Sphaerodactylus townsendi]|uniref:alpha-ketoglutarate-dependent dioxygenase alkB homolog 7, mitochondrial isoform X2 n=1 Tax=Sphaerodactylus townsendi TaxID=933632 RepID=UPI00202621F5|nr:alpha-ketoglutarate-dependent dioxygenase alkB homolog 7, mitochondrial isoform X2 [Sphaerodactylus townsendi]
MPRGWPGGGTDGGRGGSCRRGCGGGCRRAARRCCGASWAKAIHKYRETERLHWSQESREILQRVRDVAFPPQVPQLAQVHVLDLDKTGYIKPHIDSVKFCGCTIAGLSLLSPSVMRLVSEQNPRDCLDLLLERRSLYILRGPARYEFTHEILKDEESFFDGQKIPRERRISIICRNLPLPPS